MSKITRACIEGYRARLADPDTGFNPRLAAAIADAGIDLPTNFKTPISFDTANSTNYFEADISATGLEGTKIVTYPAITLFGKSANDTNQMKFQLFSGEVTVGLNCFLSYRNAKGNVPFDGIANVFEEAIVATFNDRSLGAWSTFFGFQYNGALSVRRGPLSPKGGADWLQTISFDLKATLHTS